MPGEPFAWTPTALQRETANVTRLARRLGCDDHASLHALSIDDPDRFWRAVRADLDIPFFTDWQTTVDSSCGIEWSTWFLGGALNIAHACVHRWAAERPTAEAAIWRAEDGGRRSVSWAEMSFETTRLAEALVGLGVKPGDTVGIFLPMAPEVAIAAHACAHIGAIHVPIFSGFAAPAVAARLEDAGAKVLITCDGSLRRGAAVGMKVIADEAIAHVPAVEHVVVWRRLETDCPMTEGRDAYWDDLVGDTPGVLPPLALESEHPYLLAYTSGTTGRPKGALHVHGGFLLSIARECAYPSDIRAGDRVLFATDMGWIMGPWTVVGAGALGAATVFVEGAPDWPADRIWQLVEEERVTMLGISPTLVRALIPKGDPTADFSSLRTVTTTGEPWNRGPYDWLNEHVCGGGRIPIVNVSGGTEVGACFLATSPLEPTKPMSVGFAALGLDMDVVDPDGKSLRGAVGELVCRRPWPAMTRGIWHDAERYLAAYWSRFPGVWTHGDWASVDEDGYWFLHGRSDDTLNIAGKRIGPTELESAALHCDAVVEAAAIGVPHEVKGEVPWLFCVLKPGREATAADVSVAVAAELGKAFAPARVVFIPSLPKTRTAKVVRRAIRAIVVGTDPGDLSTLENPESLDEIRAAIG